MTRPGITFQQLVDVVNHPNSVPDLQKYFATGPHEQRHRFTGGWFERLGAENPYADRNRISTDDLVAVQLLGVHIPSPVALDLLHGATGENLQERLSRIPSECHLGDQDAAEHVADCSAADSAWRLLTGLEDVNWVIAGKLLARKRPRLIPIYDSVVRCAYRRPTHFWQWLHRHLLAHEHTLLDRLIQLAAEAQLRSEVTPLRVLDVIVWMRHRDGHTPSRCLGIGH
jgi:hypothetical protein